MIELTTGSDLQTSEKYSRPRTHLERIDQTVESRRREVRWNSGIQVGRIYQEQNVYNRTTGEFPKQQNVGNRTTQNPGGLNLTTHLMFW